MIARPGGNRQMCRRARWSFEMRALLIVWLLGSIVGTIIGVLLVLEGVF